jgi:hypothetical protein
MKGRAAALLRKSGLSPAANLKQTFTSAPPDPGQSCPERCPQPRKASSDTLAEPLGDPLSIREAAGLIGCSPWTVRQRYLPAGLPHHRLTPTGKLIFYRSQVIRWLLTRQQKGGTNPT